MKSRTRYSLLAGCIAFFAVVTPFIILFVSGYRYNFSVHGFTQTGAISAKTDPEGATLTLNGISYGKTAKIVRFLNAGVYQVSLSLPGYFSWNKNLAVSSRNVTLTHLGYDAVTMFFSVPSVKQISAPTAVLGFTSGNSRVVYATAQTVYTAHVGSPNTVTASAPLPPGFSSASVITITPSPAEDYFLLIANTGAEAVFVPDEQKAYALDITVNANSWQFGDHGNLFALQGQNLINVNWHANGTSTVVTAPAIGYVWHDGYLYGIVESNGGSVLMQMNADGSNSAVLYAALPVWQHATLYLNQMNQIAILGDGTLYSFNPTLHVAEAYVSGIVVEPGTNKLFYYTKNEVGVFDPASGSIIPITRTSDTISASAASLSTGWAFYISDNQLQIIEIDTRGNQNTYQLVPVEAGATFTVDPDAKYLYLLQSGAFERLQLR
jgi:hypothetical protein